MKLRIARIILQCFSNTLFFLHLYWVQNTFSIITSNKNRIHISVTFFQLSSLALISSGSHLQISCVLKLHNQYTSYPATYLTLSWLLTPTVPCSYILSILSSPLTFLSNVIFLLYYFLHSILIDFLSVKYLTFYLTPHPQSPKWNIPLCL